MQDNIPPDDAANAQNDGNVIRFKSRQVKQDKPSHPPLLNMPQATKFLTFGMVIAFVIMWIAHELFENFPIDLIYDQLGFVSARWSGDLPFGITALLSLVTVNFLHAGWFHIGVNAATLVAFGSGIEKRMGVRDMLLIFFLSSALALLTHLLVSPHSVMPVVGASGGISGLFGAVMVMLKHDGRITGANQRILPMALMWIAISALFGAIGGPEGENIAWIAHIGGFLAGLGIAAFMFRKSRRAF